MSALKNLDQQAINSSLSLDSTSSGITLSLISKDLQEFEIDRHFALISTLVKISLDTDATAVEIPIPGVMSDVLIEIITYMNHHKGVDPPILPKPIRSKHMKELCKDLFDAEFIDRISENRRKLYDLILAANYMDIQSLFHLGCAKVAALIKGEPLDRIRTILSPSESAKVEDKERKEQQPSPPAVAPH